MYTSQKVLTCLPLLKWQYSLESLKFAYIRIHKSEMHKYTPLKLEICVHIALIK